MHCVSGLKPPSDQPMVEYKKLHNKLNWKLKSAQTDEDHTYAEQALKRLKTHREEMLQDFMQVSVELTRLWRVPTAR